jgi:hypothetical protein
LDFREEIETGASAHTLLPAGIKEHHMNLQNLVTSRPRLILPRVLAALSFIVFCGTLMADTISVNPQNVASAIAGSHPGDTLNFAPGTYNLQPRANRPALKCPGNRTYVGNGAVIALSGGPAANEQSQLVSFGTNSEVSGFTFTDAQVEFGNGSFNVHDNNFMNMPNTMAVFVSNDSNSHFDHNQFQNIGAEGIYGYPGNGNTYDNNAFDQVFEPIHLVGVCDTNDVSGNVITHATRFGIELQEGMTHLTVENNWMSDWLANGNPSGHIAISCATGGSGTYPYAGQGENITISGNVLIADADPYYNPWAACAVEIAGSVNINVTNNYSWNFGFLLFNGATGEGVNSSNNTVIGGSLTEQDGAPWPEPAPHGSGNELFGLGASNAPAPPAYPGNATGAPLISGVAATLVTP